MPWLPTQLLQMIFCTPLLLTYSDDELLKKTDEPVDYWRMKKIVSELKLVVFD